MSLKKKILGNGIATGIQKLIRVSEQLLLVPFFINAWGSAYYGEWLTLTIVPSVIAFSDLGFGTAAANSFVLKYASGDKVGAANTAKTGFLIISCMVLFGTLISFVVIFLCSYFHLFDKSLINKTDAIWSISILILARLISFYDQFFEAYYRAARKAALSINLLSVKSILNIVAGLVVLLSGYHVVAFAISQLTVNILFAFYYRTKAFNLLALWKEAKGTVLKTDVRDITTKGLGYLMSPIWQSIYFQGTTFVVRLALGPQAVTIFNTVRTLSRSVNQIYNMINGTVFPELQYEIGSGNFDRARKLFRMSVVGVILLAFIGAVFLWLLGPWFYKIWTNNKLLVPGTMWNIFVLGILLNAIWWTASMVFRAFNKPYQLSYIGVISASLSVISSYILTIKMGLVGAALGSLVLEIIMACYILPTACKLLGISLTDVFRNGKDDILSMLKIFYNKFTKFYLNKVTK